MKREFLGSEEKLKVTFWLGQEDFLEIENFNIIKTTDKAVLLGSTLGNFWLPKNKEKALSILGGYKEWYIHDEHDFLMLKKEGIVNFLSAVSKKCSEWKMCHLKSAEFKGKSICGELGVQWDGPDAGGFFHAKGKIKINVPASLVKIVSDDMYFIDIKMAKKNVRNGIGTRKHIRTPELVCALT